MKYNLSKVMKEAWKYIYEGIEKSKAMKKAWKNAKDSISYQRWKPFLDHKRDMFAKQYQIDSCDVENELWIWFNNIIRKYDVKKSCVYTFLQNQIRGFETTLRRKRKKKEMEMSTSCISEYIDPQREKFEDIISFYLEIDKKLSDNAKQILQFVFESEWSPRPCKDPTRKVSRNAVIRYFNKLQGWTVAAIKEAWEEIRVWWMEFEYGI